MRFLLSALLAAPLLLAAGPLLALAQAQEALDAPAGLSADAGRLVLIPAAEARADELRALAPGLSAELGMPVVVASEGAYRVAPGETQLHVRIRGDAVHVSVTRPDGLRVERDLVLPPDPEERAHVLIVLASNLARDQTSDLLASLRHGPDPEQGPAEATSISIEGESPEVAAEAVDASQPSAAPSVVTDVAGEPVSQEEPPVDPWRHRLWRLGMGGHIGTAPTLDGGIVPWGIAGLDLVLLPIQEVGAGLRDVGVVSDGVSTAIQLTPVVELSYRPIRELDLHVIVGCDLEVVLRDQDPSFGAAPRLGVGPRFFLVPIFSIAADVTARVIASDSFHSAITVFPQGAVPIAFSTSFAFHL